jgi:hypothetical protein
MGNLIFSNEEYNLGVSYRDGLNVEKDTNKAFNHLI